MTDSERLDYQSAFGLELDLNRQIGEAESRNTIRQMVGTNNPAALMLAGDPNPGATRRQAQLSPDYGKAFMALLKSGGKQATAELTEGFDPLFGGYALPAMPGMSAALYEGSNGAGGYAVSVPTDSQIVPLAPPDLGVRSIARVIPTATDLKIPAQSTFGTAGIKAESGASSNVFSESDPTLASFTLSAFMAGLTHTVSWELLQDVQAFQEFSVRDLLTAVDILEDGYFVTGTGTSQPQGLVGNTGTGIGSAYAFESTGSYLLGAVLDVLGTLKANYFATSSWLLNRATAVAIRRAAQTANLFEAIWTRENGRDFLYGYPVAYSNSMPSLPTATTAGVTPILFGSFSDGYIIGDRGGSGTFVKILDQPLATAGQTVLLAYKRVDGRVRRSEAIQQISISHS
jgi:HK97 family phage major capsid protein